MNMYYVEIIYVIYAGARNCISTIGNYVEFIFLIYAASARNCVLIHIMYYI